MTCGTGACAGGLLDGKVVFGVSSAVVQRGLLGDEGAVGLEERLGTRIQVESDAGLRAEEYEILGG